MPTIAIWTTQVDIWYIPLSILITGALTFAVTGIRMSASYAASEGASATLSTLLKTGDVLKIAHVIQEGRTIAILAETPLFPSKRFINLYEVKLPEEGLECGAEYVYKETETASGARERELIPHYYPNRIRTAA